MNTLFITCMSGNAEYITEALGDVQYTHSYWIFLAPLIMAVLDVVTGWIQATINKTWDSTKMRYGLLRKSAMMLIVITAYLFEFAIEAVAKAHVATFASIYIIIMEILSVIENLDHAGIPVPPFIRDHLGKVKDNMDNPGGTEA